MSPKQVCRVSTGICELTALERAFVVFYAGITFVASDGSTRRGHIGDTLSCFLLLLQRHPVRSGSCVFLRFRFGFPLSRRRRGFKSRRGRQFNTLREESLLSV